MATPYQDLIPEARAFLSDLAQNNSRDWFLAHKARYDSQLKAPALLLLEEIAALWGGEIGQHLKPKLFRANRDVRFSKDKTPYHLHLHMLWAEPDGLGWFLGIAPDYVTAGGGVMGFSKTQLGSWRACVDGPDGARLTTALQGWTGRLDDPELKRVPAPYDKDHPQAPLLRRKSFNLWQDIEGQSAQNGLRPALLTAFGEIRPVLDHVRRMI